MDLFLIILLYTFLGGSIKFIDQAYDEESYSIRSAKVMAVMAGIIMGYLMARDSPFSTAFFLAMLISLVLARKIDNQAFAIGTILAIASLIAFYPSSVVSWTAIPVVVFLLAGFIDEVADDMVEKYDITGSLQIFLNYRPFSDIALIAMVLLGTFSWLYLLPYFGFTFTYMFVERWSEKDRSLSDGVDWIKDRVLRRAN